MAQAANASANPAHRRPSNVQGTEGYRPSDSQSPHDQIDPNIAGGAGYGMSGDDAGDDPLSPAGKGKRELSTSKRAAQNRAAQV